MQATERADHETATSRDEIDRAVELLNGRRTAVLTGAGVSTDSGIPAYRGAGAPPRSNPMTVQLFLENEAARRRYWVGGHLGWNRFSAIDPNGGHRALAEMERRGDVTGVVTQNVDGLHLRAGSTHVVELHGSMRHISCLTCGQLFDRGSVAAQIDELNPWITVPENVVLNPDGDVSPESTEGFIVPTCTVCGGMLKPDVVFFGEFIPADRFRVSESLLRASDALLVAGTSLTVNSGIRVIERARRRGLPLIIINREPTRADDWADLTIHGGTTPALTEIARRLGEEGGQTLP